ncbi:hypothetical protein [Oscillibacter sp. 1-3]|nr:hypothetical protein [Oscillibacter sp. 1-3]
MPDQQGGIVKRGTDEAKHGDKDGSSSNEYVAICRGVRYMRRDSI